MPLLVLLILFYPRTLMPDSSTIRAQRTRARQRLGIAWEPLLCSRCDDPHRGRHGGLCRKCWLKTPAGKADIRERVNRHRDNKQAQGDPL